MPEPEVFSMEEVLAAQDDPDVPMSEKQVFSMEEVVWGDDVENAIKTNQPQGYELESNIHNAMSHGDRDMGENIRISYERGEAYQSLKQMAYSYVGDQEGLKKDIAPLRLEMDRRNMEDPVDGKWWADAIYSVANMIPGVIGGAVEGVKYGSAAGIGVGVMPGGQAFAPLAFGIGGTYGSMKYWYRDGVSEIYMDMVDEGVPDDIAVPVSAIGGAMYGAIEFSQVFKLIPGSNKAVKKMVRKSVTSTIKNAVKKYGSLWAQEVTEEALQEIILTAAKDIGTNAAQITNIGIGQMVERAAKGGFQAAKESALPMLLMLAPGQAVDTARAVGGRKGKPVEPKQSELQKHYTPSETLTAEEKDIENKAFQYLEENQETAKADYKERVRAEFGTDRVVSGDEAKFIIPGVNKDNADMFRIVHEPASAFAKVERDIILADKTTTHLPAVVMAGGSGSGKTSSLRNITGQFIDDTYAVIFDTNSNSQGSLDKNIEIVKKTGRDVIVFYVERDPVKAWASVIDRGIRTGRPVPMNIHIINQGSRPTIRQAFEKYKNDKKVAIRVLDNTRGAENQRVGGLELLLSEDYTTTEARDSLIKKLNGVLDEKIKSGQITEAQAAPFRFRSEGAEIRRGSYEVSTKGDQEGALTKYEFDPKSAFTIAVDEGGHTINPITGEYPKTGYTYSFDKAKEKKIAQSKWQDMTDEQLADELEAYVKDYAEDWKVDNQYFGLWIDEGTLYLDVVKNSSDYDIALDEAAAASQIGIFDVEAVDVINVKDALNEREQKRQEASGANRPQDSTTGGLRQSSQKAQESPASKQAEEELKQALKRPKAKSKAAREGARIIDKVLVPISTRLKKINPSLKSALRKYEFDVNKHILDDEKAVMPFLRKMEKLGKKDFVKLDLALKNGNEAHIDDVIKRKKMTKEYNALRKVLNRLYNDAKSVGYKIGYLNNYAPRRVNDVEAFIAHFYDSDDSHLIRAAVQNKEKEVGRKLEDAEIAALINTLLRGYEVSGIQLSRPGYLKERNIDHITPELNDYYYSTPSAIVDYIYSVNDHVAARRFFGKHVQINNQAVPLSESEVETDTKRQASIYDFNLETTIGAYVLDLLVRGEINASQEMELKEILTARFSPKGPGAFVAGLKNLGYITTMGNPISALTQIGDTAFTFFRAGLLNPGLTIAETAKAAVGLSKVTKEDIGIERIAQEFSEGSKVQKALTKVFKLVGLNYMDRLGKQSLINVAYKKYKQQATRKKPTKKFLEAMNNIYGDEAGQTIDDLKNDRVTDNVKLLLFNELADYQPVSLSEMPQGYLRGGNGRVLYMLKTYTIKMWDVYHNQVFLEKDRILAAQNFIRLTFALVMMNATADIIKDWILNRKTDMAEIIWENMLRLAGFSKYQFYEAKREGLGRAIAKGYLIPPLEPINTADLLIKDISRAVENGEISFDQLDSIQRIPVAGKLVYWWFGRGREKAGKKKKSRSRV